MGLSVLPHQAGPIHAEDHMELLDGHVVYQHIKGSLQKSGIDGEYRHNSLLRHTGAHGHRVALGDAHVEKPFREPLGKVSEAGAALHGGGDGAEVGVALSQPAQHPAKDGGKILPGGLAWRSVLRMEGADPVEIGRGLLRGGIALAFDGAHMEQHRALQMLGELQQPGQLAQVMSVHRADIGKAHVLKHAAGQQSALDRLFDPVGQGIEVSAAGDLPGKGPVKLLEAQIGGLEMMPPQQGGDAAHVLLDAHAVVIDNDHHPLAAAAGVGESLVGKAAGEGAVADEGQHVIVLPPDGPGPGHAHRHRHRVGGVAGNKGVVDALHRLGKAGDAPILAQGAHLLRPAGEDFMDIALVAHVKDHPVPAGVVGPVDGHRQLHRPQVGGQMAAGLGHRLNQIPAQLLAQGQPLAVGQVGQRQGEIL